MLHSAARRVALGTEWTRCSLQKSVVAVKATCACLGSLHPSFQLQLRRFSPWRIRSHPENPAKLLETAPGTAGALGLWHQPMQSRVGVSSPEPSMKTVIVAALFAASAAFANTPAPAAAPAAQPAPAAEAKTEAAAPEAQGEMKGEMKAETKTETKHEGKATKKGTKTKTEKKTTTETKTEG
ncbi:hypothetical protein ASNO1_07370 [Corallococcus caeni]|uniref:Uncharacterized protein n=4 Tax=Corallococcus TaxID=83461 RepID=A0ABQ6QKE4_9BACT|nr:hypothetical protein ASNO1_07370 [Corallococcus sp. NO1]